MKGQYTTEQLRFFLAGIVLGIAGNMMHKDTGYNPARCLVSVLVDNYKIETAENMDALMLNIVETFNDDLEDHRKKKGHKHDTRANRSASGRARNKTS